MNRPISTLLFATVLMFITAAAQAQRIPRNYWEVGYSKVQYTSLEDSDPTRRLLSEQEADGPGLSFVYGREFGNWMGVEFHLGIASGGPATVIGSKYESIYGAAFYRLNIPFENVNIYFLGGPSYHKTDLGPTSYLGTATTSGSEPAYGFGIDLMSSVDKMIAFEVLRIDDDDPTDIVTLAYKSMFSFGGGP